jgi:DNA replication protein DnaC
MMPKTVDRIMEMSTAIIKISGESYRAKNRRKDVPF